MVFCFALLAARDFEPDKYNTCALVGNGGILLANKKGGFEKYVGSKTTYKMTNNLAAKHYQNHKRPPGMHEDFNVLFRKKSHKRFATRLMEMYPKIRFLLLAPEFVEHVQKQWAMVNEKMADGGFANVYEYNAAPTVSSNCVNTITINNNI
eukprot:scaffold208402_cov44-Prasinocladus_malaysianus.AAC.1